MRKLILTILIFLFLLPNGLAYANNNLKLPENCYTEEGKIKIYSNGSWTETTKIDAEIDNFDSRIPKLIFYGADDSKIEGIIIYPNYNELTVGSFDLQWKFTPNDTKYEIKTGTFHFNLFPADTEKSKGKLENIGEETVIPTLTASTIVLTENTTYDININEKAISAVYSWESSNPDIAKVAKNGLVTSVKTGKATITCKVTDSTGSVNVLSTDVIVGTDDDNYPVLSETELNLEVGEVFDVDVENGVKGSKYKWTVSDKTLTKVTSSTGKITAQKTGSGAIYCTITTPDKKVIVLKCDIEIN